jgi:hypothetical protein
VMKDVKCVMLGSRDPRSGLWRVNLKNSKPAIQSAYNHEHGAINQKELIKYLHAVFFSPVKSTCIAAIKNGNFTPRPGLTELAAERDLSKSSATLKGHLNQQRMNARSTKIKEEEKCVNTDANLDNRIKKNCIYATTTDAGQIYMDQTGVFLWFPAKKTKSSWYYMSMMAMPYWQNPPKTEQRQNY